MHVSPHTHFYNDRKYINKESILNKMIAIKYIPIYMSNNWAYIIMCNIVWLFYWLFMYFTVYIDINFNYV